VSVFDGRYRKDFVSGVPATAFGETLTLSDTAGNIAALTTAQISALRALDVIAIAATDTSVVLTVAQAMALGLSAFE
jgi:hypothetical protein